MSQPWVCPKCERVYSAYVLDCRKCNEKVDRKDEEMIEKIDEANIKCRLNAAKSGYAHLYDYVEKKLK